MYYIVELFYYGCPESLNGLAEMCYLFMVLFFASVYFLAHTLKPVETLDLLHGHGVKVYIDGGILNYMYRSCCLIVSFCRACT